MINRRSSRICSRQRWDVAAQVVLRTQRSRAPRCRKDLRLDARAIAPGWERSSAAKVVVDLDEVDPLFSNGGGRANRQAHWATFGDFRQAHWATRSPGSLVHPRGG